MYKSTGVLAITLLQSVFSSTTVPVLFPSPECARGVILPRPSSSIVQVQYSSLPKKHSMRTVTLQVVFLVHARQKYFFHCTREHQSILMKNKESFMLITLVFLMHFFKILVLCIPKAKSSRCWIFTSTRTSPALVTFLLTRSKITCMGQKFQQVPLSLCSRVFIHANTITGV